MPKIEINNDLCELTHVADFIKNVSAKKNIPESVIFDINLAVDEAVTNVISYGFKDELEHKIFLTLHVEENKIKITLEDDGVEFNPLLSNEPDLEKNVKEKPIGGLGIYFIKAKMDKVNYERNNNINSLILEKFY
ncbi:MAG: ATP-binding protein [Bacteroidetes bacterium]|nr:ATP-binding protein [Bacteroidota bacterium]MBU1678533.1 ATP-binding protein [Bacteroidota bacterium]MBU2508246.1 ATP-binding protein [Bacteroidota bacterium]